MILCQCISVSQYWVRKSSTQKNAVTGVTAFFDTFCDTLHPLTKCILPLTQCIWPAGYNIKLRISDFSSNCLPCLVEDKEKGKETVPLKSVGPSRP